MTCENCGLESSDLTGWVKLVSVEATYDETSTIAPWVASAPHIDRFFHSAECLNGWKAAKGLT